MTYGLELLVLYFVGGDSQSMVDTLVELESFPVRLSILAGSD